MQRKTPTKRETKTPKKPVHDFRPGQGIKLRGGSKVVFLHDAKKPGQIVVRAKESHFHQIGSAEQQRQTQRNLRIKALEPKVFANSASKAEERELHALWAESRRAPLAQGKINLTQVRAVSINDVVLAKPQKPKFSLVSKTERRQLQRLDLFKKARAIKYAQSNGAALRFLSLRGIIVKRIPDETDLLRKMGRLKKVHRR